MTRPDLDALEALLAKAEFHKMEQDGFTTTMVTSNGDGHPWRIGKPQGALIVAAVNALPGLIARVRELEQWQRDMVEKAAAKSLDGYRELAARAAAAENERDEARAAALAMRERCAQACEELSLHYDGRESEASSRVYADLCRGSRNGADACAAAIRALEV